MYYVLTCESANSIREKYFVVHEVGQNGWLTLRLTHIRDNGVLTDITGTLHPFWKGRVSKNTTEDGKQLVKIYSPFGGGRDDTALLTPVEDLP